ncbi:isoflavone reductase family protein [Tripterygium wilfordii]|uniref:Isoflavone reductase family protein n=2 Tax=Tripterygium wilfordii TaxID=458696 RepID=A0A7J7CZ67_TRIWF|nr:isoflavone reductase family protein [Tripterygium wilfordii]
MASQPSPPKFPSSLQLQRVDRAFSQPISPSRTTTPGGPTRAVPQQLSPSKKLESTTQDIPQPQPISTELPPSASKEEPKPKDPEPKTPPASEPPSKHQIDSPVETISQQGVKAAQATQAPSPGSLIAPNSGAAPQQQAIAPTKAEEKLKDTDERKKAREESHEKKKTITTSPLDGKVIKTVDTTQPKDKSAYSKSLQKNSLSNGEQAPLQKEIKEDISKFVQKLTTEQSKQPMDEKPISVMTLAGENKGASMHLGSQAKKRGGSLHIHRGYKTNPEDSPDATTDGEGRGRSKGKHKDPKTKEEMATKAYVNSNTQGVNNSIMFGSSVNERNPGVQLAFSHNFAEPSRYSSKPEPLETSKAEFNITPAEKLTYAPTVRRRCLRGLFMESSDSEPDNPDKPRRHGCRYNCSAKKKDEEIAIL